MDTHEIPPAEGTGPAPEESLGLEELSQALAQREARLAELEGAVAHLSEVLQQKEAALRSQEAQLSRLTEDLALAVGRYRTALLASAPEVPEELIQGDTIQDLEGSMERAQKLVARIRSQMEAALLKQQVPAGAPLRQAPDVAGLSSKDKIALGLARGVR